MYHRTFFAAQLLVGAVIGRGTGDGASQANSFEVLLLDNADYTLELFPYNGYSNGVSELHGDVKVINKSGGSMSSRLEFGWCVEISTTPNKWDCMRVRTLLNPDLIVNDPTEVNNFTMTDHHATDIRDDANLSTLQAAGTELQNDPDYLSEDRTINWYGLNSGRSYKTCTKTDSTGDFVNCSDVNKHYFRDFTTTQSADVDYQA